MKQRRFVTILFTLILTIVVLPSTALAADVYNYKDQFADVYFYHEDGCIGTSVIVYAFGNTYHNPSGPKNGQSSVSISVYQYDNCAAQLLQDSSGFAVLDAAALRMNNLNSATLNATVDLYNYVTGSSYTAHVSLNWTGTGNISRGNSHSHQQIGSCIHNNRWNGSWRNAQIVGSVSDGATNFTPTPSYFGLLQLAKSGSVSVGCGYP